MLGPYIKSRGARGIEMSSNVDLITVEAYIWGVLCRTQVNENFMTSLFFLNLLNYFNSCSLLGKDNINIVESVESASLNMNISQLSNN